MAISEKDYCSKICGAGCCKVFDGEKEIKRCPKLTEDNLCSYYKERFEWHLPFSFFHLAEKNGRLGRLVVVEQKCGSIKEALKRESFPAHIKKRCCYEHPELLEAYD